LKKINNKSNDNIYDYNKFIALSDVEKYNILELEAKDRLSMEKSLMKAAARIKILSQKQYNV